MAHACRHKGDFEITIGNEIDTKLLQEGPNWILYCTITHRKPTELIPKRFWFGNSSTDSTEYVSQNFSVRSIQGFGNPRLTVIAETKNNSSNTLVR